ncbi:MAG: hypothetical protein IJO51_02475, partial [Clostridia bacterium]|nr:hypothetical protein [Clostridia bacterium]
ATGGQCRRRFPGIHFPEIYGFQRVPAKILMISRSAGARPAANAAADFREFIFRKSMDFKGSPRKS